VSREPLVTAEKVHVIVVLRLCELEITPGRRQSRSERQAAIEAMRKSAEPALVEIDRIPRPVGGKRLVSCVTAPWRFSLICKAPVHAKPEPTEKTFH
jgi:hypothetical protein